MSLFAQTMREQDDIFYATFPAAAAARHKEMYGAEFYCTSPPIADCHEDDPLLRTPPLQHAYVVLTYDYSQPIVDGSYSPSGAYAHPPDTPMSDFSAGSPRSDSDEYSDSATHHQLYPVQQRYQQQQQSQAHFSPQQQFQHFQHQYQRLDPLFHSPSPPSTSPSSRQHSFDDTTYPPSRPSAPPPLAHAHLPPTSRHQAQTQIQTSAAITSTIGGCHPSSHSQTPTGIHQTQTPIQTQTVAAASMRLSPLPSKRQLEKKPPLACLFCRGRKIACGAPLPGSTDKTCNQCQRRSLPCEYPSESRRGMRKKKTEPAPEIGIDPKNPLAGLAPLSTSPPVVVKKDEVVTPVLSSKSLL